mmetsp:Transcript_21077/g.29756  ORF Transcript_21077/g.29756 Transcript_21077/m.29756 type:complete len:471 (+) Transcript_21077:228-1640(+)
MHSTATATFTSHNVNLAIDICAALTFELKSNTPANHIFRDDNYDNLKRMGACHGTCHKGGETGKDNAFSLTSATETSTGFSAGGGDCYEGDMMIDDILMPSKDQDQMMDGESDIEIFYDAVEFLDDFDSANDVQSSVIEILRGGHGHGNYGGSPHSTSPDSVAYAYSNSHLNQNQNNHINNYHSNNGAYREQPPPSSSRLGTTYYAPPPAPKELPLRFLRAGKGDPVEGQRRYEETLKWRAEHKMDYILDEAFPHFELIKANYPHFFHLRGRNNEPVYYESPAKIDLKALRRGGVTFDELLRHYAMVTEFCWQYVEGDDFSKSIYIIDLEGIRITDFVGECVDFLKSTAKFTGAHYPERSGYIMVINVPSWFKIIWNVVKPLIDPVTQEKVYILRGKDEIFKNLLERVPIENIPPEYGGTSMPLGQAPEEQMLWNLMRHNNDRANGCLKCQGAGGQPPCHYCSFTPWRSY